jgi:uncharacterized protein (DUF2384 family)
LEQRDAVDRPLRFIADEVLHSRSQVVLIERVWSDLLRVYEPDAARSWLWGFNPFLGDRRPIDVVRAGRVDEVIRGIRAEHADSFA